LEHKQQATNDCKIAKINDFLDDHLFKQVLQRGSRKIFRSCRSLSSFIHCDWHTAMWRGRLCHPMAADNKAL